MPDHLKDVLDAILAAVKEKYADDIALMIVYGSALNGTADDKSDLDILFIPKNWTGRNLAKTFILGGIGYDIWCAGWETLRAMLRWEDMRVSILADSELVYAGSEEDRKNYELMRNNARRVTELPLSAHDYEPALKFVTNAKNFYGTLCLGETASIGGILMELVNAVCFVNRRYLKYGAKKIPEEIAQYPRLPENFIENYRRAVREPENAAAICKSLIQSTEAFVHGQFAQYTGHPGLAAHCTGMYEEISSHWNKIRRCCDAGDAEGALLAASSLQHDLDYAKITIGQTFDLMQAWNGRDLDAFRRSCDAVEQDFIAALRENGVPIRYLSSADALKQLLLDAHDEEDN
ncbi:MAG: nucleotidyltransferase domain-containing protein [Clostridia bacterium]|nr:nucleotidyltransferase domain-containing protein [Clostridia bacterium]